MFSDETRIKLDKYGVVVPLLAVIAGSLIWSGYATYHHALSPTVPPLVASMLIVTLDGSVVVTTPVWLSTRLPRGVRNYAGVICCAALSGSILINYSETGLPGVFPPLIAGVLIHLVGLVLRAHPVNPTAGSGSVDVETVGVDVSVEHQMPSTDPSPDVVVPKPVVPARPAIKPVAVPDPELTPSQIVFGLLDAAHSKGVPLPGGPELTQAVRAAGHEVNDEYGRTTKARWRKRGDDQVAA